MVFLGFAILALMRVIEKVYIKYSSDIIKPGISFMRFNTFYQFMAAILSLFAFFIYGISGFNLPTFLCAAVLGILLSLDFYLSLEALKGTSLVIVTMYGLGGLIISCILGYFMFGEKISILQWVGLVIFFVGAYLLTPLSKGDKKRISVKTFIILIIDVIVNGFVMIAQKYFSLKIEGGNTATFSFLTFLVSGFFMAIGWCILFFKEKKVKPLNSECENINESATNDNNKQVKTFLGMQPIQYFYGLMLAVSLVGLNMIITEMGKTVSSVILFPTSSAITIMITTLIGWIKFKEKMTVKNIIGLVLGGISIAIIGVFTPEFMAGL